MIERIRSHSAARPALVDAQRGPRMTYGELADEIERGRETLEALGRRTLVCVVATNTLDSIVLYLACLDAGYPLLWVGDRGLERLTHLCETYRPGILAVPSDLATPEGYVPARRSAGFVPGYRICTLQANAATNSELHPDLALILLTSGSTGSPRGVRLTRHNLSCSAASICRYLRLGPDERAVQSLPVDHAYGLSVVNSHLYAGGTLVTTGASFMTPEFWEHVARYGCTSFAGVSFVYQTLHRLDFDPLRYPTLRTLTHSGDRLDRQLTLHFEQRCRESGAAFVKMYGASEATARISYVPPDCLAENPEAIGIPVPDGRIRLEPVPGVDDRWEIVFEGPTVMLGYATSLDCLARGDESRGVLHTGDLGRVNDNGMFVFEGRINRLAKIFGSRIQLDDVEQELHRAFPLKAAVCATDAELSVHVEPFGDVHDEAIRRHLARWLRVPPAAVVVTVLAALPRTANGKTDYHRLSA